MVNPQSHYNVPVAIPCYHQEVTVYEVRYCCIRCYCPPRAVVLIRTSNRILSASGIESYKLVPTRIGLFFSFKTFFFKIWSEKWALFCRPTLPLFNVSWTNHGPRKRLDESLKNYFVVPGPPVMLPCTDDN